MTQEKNEWEKKSNIKTKKREKDEELTCAAFEQSFCRFILYFLLPFHFYILQRKKNPFFFYYKYLDVGWFLYIIVLLVSS